MDVAADRAAIADKGLVEILAVIQRVGAHHGTDLDMTPGLVDAGGADQLGPRRFQRVEKRGVGKAGRRRRQVGHGVAGR